MSLTSQVNDVSYYSGYDIDKIVRIYTGSYNAATDVISRNFIFGGVPYTAWFYRIAHNLGRPVACEMQWSIDGGTTYIDGGVANSSFISKIAFSDSTYIYIFDAASVIGAGTVHYRVWASWINDYDTTNPLVDVETYTDVPQQFDSRENFQKIVDQNVLSFTPGTLGATETQNVPYILDYTPNVKVWFEAFSGEVWPLNAGGLSNIFLMSDTQDECSLAIDSNSANITFYKYSNANRRAWYKIYYDQT